MEHIQAQVIEANTEHVIAALSLQSWMTQATGVAHAGIVTAIADHTAACAARMVSPNNDTFVSIQVHTSLLRPAAGPTLRVIGRPLRVGKRVAFAEAEVYSVDEDVEKLCATFTVSLISAPPAPLT